MAFFLLVNFDEEGRKEQHKREWPHAGEMYPTFNLNIIFAVRGTEVLEWDLNKRVLADKEGSKS